MFTTLIVKPLFNILVLIYAILPGHNFGLALIIFTVLIRLLLWPLVKKQLHQAKAMKKLQPELKKIKAATKGNRQKETQLTMELYKEKGINPIGTLPVFILQIIILIGLNSGIRKIISSPKNVVSFSYSSIQHLSWMEKLSHNIHLFDDSLFGVVNLTRSALSHAGVYWPAMVIVFLSACSQYFISRQLLPSSGEKRKLRDIMKEAGTGKQADQSEITAAVGRSTSYFLPVIIFFFTVGLASSLSLYWLTSGVAAYIQQAIALREDEEELEELADKPIKNTKAIPEAQIVSEPKPKKHAKKHKKGRRR